MTISHKTKTNMYYSLRKSVNSFLKRKKKCNIFPSFAAINRNEHHSSHSFKRKQRRRKKNFLLTRVRFNLSTEPEFLCKLLLTLKHERMQFGQEKGKDYLAKMKNGCLRRNECNACTRIFFTYMYISG